MLVTLYYKESFLDSNNIYKSIVRLKLTEITYNIFIIYYLIYVCNLQQCASYNKFTSQKKKKLIFKFLRRLNQFLANKLWIIQICLTSVMNLRIAQQVSMTNNGAEAHCF